MSVTPQTNTTLEEIALKLSKSDNIVICGHVNPDGDCLGSQLGLACALRTLGKSVSCVLANTDSVDSSFSYLPGAADMVSAKEYDGSCDVFVAVDVPSRERLGEAGCALLDRAALTITIDHHSVDKAMSMLSYTDPDAASTTTLVWAVSNLLGASTREVAQCCYTGLVTDTGRFQNQNTNAQALFSAAQMVEAGAEPSQVAREVFQNQSLASLRIEIVALSRLRFSSDCERSVCVSYLTREDYEACSASKEDADHIIDRLRNLQGVRVACMLREQDEVVRGSLRAKDDVDVAAVARSLEGGGHRAAAGLTLRMPVVSAAEFMAEYLKLYLEDAIDPSDQGAVEALKDTYVGDMEARDPQASTRKGAAR